MYLLSFYFVIDFMLLLLYNAIRGDNMQIFKFNENKEKFTEKLKQLLKDNNITRDELAEKTGISKSTIDNYCKASNTINPSVENAYNIARALNVSVEELLCVTNTNATEDDFYPNLNDITVAGIFRAVNYLLVAFGEEDILQPQNIKYIIASGEFNQYQVDAETSVPTLSFFYFDNQGKPQLTPLGSYLNKIMENINIKKELINIGEEETYITMLKKWANIDKLVYSGKELYEPFDFDLEDDMPF